MARSSGRRGRPWRRIRAQVLAASTTCWLCGHDGADSADHLIPRAVCLAIGEPALLEDISNLRPAHYHPCPECGIRCNVVRGAGTPKRRPGASRQW